MMTDTARRQYERHGEGYASDLTAAEFELIEPLLPKARPGGRNRSVDLRAVLNAIFYLLRIGCPWRMLPCEFLPRSAVYGYFRQFWHYGTWTKLWQAALRVTREAAGKAASPTVGVVDSQSLKTTESGGIKGFDAGKKVPSWPAGHAHFMDRIIRLLTDDGPQASHFERHAGPTAGHHGS